MAVFRLINFKNCSFCILLVLAHTLQGQSSDSSRFHECFDEFIAFWDQQHLNAFFSEETPPDLVVLRTIQPGNVQELFFQSKNQSFKTRNHNDGSWAKIEPADTDLADFVVTYWPALRDDQVKPFRSIPNNKEESGNASVSEDKAISPSAAVSMSQDTKTQVVQDLTYAYVMYYRNICVQRHFNRKDLDISWAQENATYIFNQTLKLTEMHHLMDALFLPK